MRIAFDGTTLTPGRTGVGYYTEHLLQHLAREVESTGDELIVVSNQPIDTRAAAAAARARARPAALPAAHRLDAVAAPARVLDDVRPDVAHFTNGMLPLGTRGARRSSPSTT